MQLDNNILLIRQVKRKRKRSFLSFKKESSSRLLKKWYCNNHLLRFNHVNIIIYWFTCCEIYKHKRKRLRFAAVRNEVIDRIQWKNKKKKKRKRI